MEGERKRIRINVGEEEIKYGYEEFVVKDDLSNLESVIREKGVAIVRNVLDEKECDELVSGMWGFLEHATGAFPEEKRIIRTEEKSWCNLTELFPMHSMLIQHWGIGHTQCVWDVRQNPKVVEVFRELWKTPDLLVSFDGASFHMPHETTRKGFYRGNSWFHTDQRLSDSKFQCVQGWVTGLDVNEGDATLAVLCGSQNFHADYAKRFNYSTEKMDWHKISSHEELEFFVREKNCPRVSIKCPKGSLVLWDSRTMHCGQESLRSRKVPNFRCIAYICMIPRSLATPKEIIKKQKAFTDKRTTSHWPQKSKYFPKTPRTYNKPLAGTVQISSVPLVLTPLGHTLAGF
jgi:hypothetical protein